MGRNVVYICHITKKAGTRLDIPVACACFLKLFNGMSACGCQALGMRRQPPCDAHCRLVSEHQLAIEGIDEDGLIAIYLFGQYLFAEIVEHVALYGALNRACTKLGIVAKVG